MEINGTDTLTFIIFAMGLATVILSVVVSLRFVKSSHTLEGQSKKLSKAIAWQLAGESVIGLGTLVFATGAHFGWLNNWPIEVQSTLRFVMFAATSFTTAHLWLVILRR